MKPSLGKRRGVLVTAFVLVLATSGACGKFSSSDSANDSTDTTEAGEVGAGLGVPSTQPLVTRPGAVTTAAPVAADPCKTKPSSSTATRDNRLKLVLNVSGVCFKQADNIGLSLVVTNITSSVVHYDPNQLTIFTIKAPQGEQKRRWEDDDCAGRTAERKRALDLAPGASVTLSTTYPMTESCRRLETGSYDVQAVFLVCDDGYDSGYCDTAKDTQYTAQPVNITLSS
ncbi:MAG: hypothetical protein Q8K63_10055 [Acidimicrobiales bacterium]|nr:hypothetical protein [Acidimicrobiales bacterium]